MSTTRARAVAKEGAASTLTALEEHDALPPRRSARQRLTQSFDTHRRAHSSKATQRTRFGSSTNSSSTTTRGGVQDPAASTSEVIIASSNPSSVVATAALLATPAGKSGRAARYSRAEDKENAPPAAPKASGSSRRAGTSQQEQTSHIARKASIDSLAELEAAYVDTSRDTTKVIPPDSSMIQAQEQPAHSTPLVSPLPASGSNRAKIKDVPFSSLLDEGMLSENDLSCEPLRTAGMSRDAIDPQDNEARLRRRQMTDNKLEMVKSFVSSSDHHRHLLHPFSIAAYHDAGPSTERGRRVIDKVQSSGGEGGDDSELDDEQDEFGFFSVLRRSKARELASQGSIGNEGREVHRMLTYVGDAEDEARLGSAASSQQPSARSSRAHNDDDDDIDSLQALLRSSPSASDLGNSMKTAEGSDHDAQSDVTMATDDYLVEWSTKGKKKKSGKVRAPSTTKKHSATKAPSKPSRASQKSHPRPKARITPHTLSEGKNRASGNSQKKKTEITSRGPTKSSKSTGKGQKRASDARCVRTSPDEGKDDDDDICKGNSPPAVPSASSPLDVDDDDDDDVGGVIGRTRRRRSTRTSARGAPLPLTTAAAKKSKDEREFATRKTLIGQSSGIPRRKQPAAEQRGSDDLLPTVRQTRLKVYDELDDYSLGEEWVI